MANLETPEQVREKMAQRLFELKQRREEERQEEVARKTEQRFRDSNFPPWLFRYRRPQTRGSQVWSPTLPNSKRIVTVRQKIKGWLKNYGGINLRLIVGSWLKEKGRKRTYRSWRKTQTCSRHYDCSWLAKRYQITYQGAREKSNSSWKANACWIMEERGRTRKRIGKTEIHLE